MNSSAAPQHRVWRPGRPVPLGAVLSSHRRGPGDPAHRVQEDGVIWRATRAATGPALLRLQADAAAGEVHAHAWGEGAEWVLDGVPQLLGDHDDPGPFSPLPEHPKLVGAWRSRPHWRVTRSRAVFEALTAAALEQRVTGGEAHASWRALMLRYGDPAPGPAGVRGTFAAGMRLPLSPEQALAVPSWAWLKLGVDLARRRVVLAAARVAGRLEQTLEIEGPDAGEQIAARLRTVPGVGVWTAAEIRQRAHGDADAFSWSDFHVARNVSWALTGQVMDDAGCAEVIECYRGQRYRVQRLLELARIARPRVAPRMTLPTHLPR